MRSLLLEDWDADDWLLYEEAMFTSPGLHYGSRLPRDEKEGGFLGGALCDLPLPPVAYVVERECAGVKGNNATCLALLIAIDNSR